MLSYSIYDECLSWQGGILLNHEIEHNHDVNTMGKFFNYVTTRQYRIRRSTCRTTTAASRAHISILNLGEWKKNFPSRGSTFFFRNPIRKVQKKLRERPLPFAPPNEGPGNINVETHTVYFVHTIELKPLWPIVSILKRGRFLYVVTFDINSRVFKYTD